MICMSPWNIDIETIVNCVDFHTWSVMPSDIFDSKQQLFNVNDDRCVESSLF